MRVWKKLISLTLAGALCAGLGLTGAFGSGGDQESKVQKAVENVNAVFTETAMAAEYSGGTKYFYGQLEGQEKKFYDAMLKMYNDGVMRAGGDLDLVAGGYVTTDQLKKYTEGDQGLLDSMGAARDAFQYDYPDAFYVDFSALSLRVVRDKAGTLHGYLGKGKRADYYMPGFQSKSDVDKAAAAYEQKIGEVVAKAKSEGGDDLSEQVCSVHDYLTHNMIYRYEYQVSAGNARTAYDALIHGEGVCEAYARGFKAVLDRMGIPCVCVYGLYQSRDAVNEEHIWNYVQIDGKWYGVDVTHDDPTNKAWTEKFSKHETRQYCLVGQMDLAGHHFPSGIMSAANHEFTYPQLEQEALRGSYFVESGDLKVQVVQEYITDDGESITGGAYCVSYRGKNYTQNAADGYYLLVRYYMYAPSTDEWTVSDWSYMDPWPMTRDNPKAAEDLEPSQPMEGLGSYIKLPLPQVKKAQFAVTTIAPGYSKNMNEEQLKEAFIKNNGLYYQGNPLLLTVMTKEIVNKWGDYQALPYLKKTTPSMTGALTTGVTYHMVFEFDQKLEQKEGEDVDVVISETETLNADKGAGSAVKNSKISGVTFDGDRTVSFDFMPSASFADDTTAYSLQVEGLVGIDSKRAPIPATYTACAPCKVYAYKAQGFDWNVFGQPQLLETSDLSTSGWSANDMDTGEPSDIQISDKITHRLTLVTTEASKKQEKEMLDVLDKSEEYGDDEILASKMYNIKLTLCKSQIIKTGEGVRVSVGFPAGYDYDESLDGVTFKAYHYIVDPKTNEITGVEEIPVTVTKYGLIITVKSFSPFTVAAVHSDGADTSKSVVVSSNLNGKITDADGKALNGAAGILDLKSAGDNRTVKVQADEGYEIEEIRLNDEIIRITDKNEMDIALNYNDLERSTIIGASFVSVDAYQGEEPSTNEGQSRSADNGGASSGTGNGSTGSGSGSNAAGADNGETPGGGSAVNTDNAGNGGSAGAEIAGTIGGSASKGGSTSKGGSASKTGSAAKSGTAGGAKGGSGLSGSQGQELIVGSIGDEEGADSGTGLGRSEQSAGSKTSGDSRSEAVNASDAKLSDKASSSKAELMGSDRPFGGRKVFICAIVVVGGLAAVTGYCLKKK